MLPPLLDWICHSVGRWIPAHSLYPCVILFVDIPSLFHTTVTLHQDRFCSLLYAYRQMNRFTGPWACIIYSLILQIGMLIVFSLEKKFLKPKISSNSCLFFVFQYFHSLHFQTQTDNAFSSRDLNLKQHMLGKCLTPQLYFLFSSLWILIVAVIIYWVITRCQKLLQVFQVLFCLKLKEFYGMNYENYVIHPRSQ